MKSISDKVKVFEGRLPKGFDASVRILQRPYTTISADEYQSLWKMLDESGDTDFFVFEGEVVTIGNADGGYAIMPIDFDFQRGLTKHLTRRQKLDYGIAFENSHLLTADSLLDIR